MRWYDEYLFVSEVCDLHFLEANGAGWGILNLIRLIKRKGFAAFDSCPAQTKWAPTSYSKVLDLIAPLVGVVTLVTHLKIWAHLAEKASFSLKKTQDGSHAVQDGKSPRIAETKEFNRIHRNHVKLHWYSGHAPLNQNLQDIEQKLSWDKKPTNIYQMMFKNITNYVFFVFCPGYLKKKNTPSIVPSMHQVGPPKYPRFGALNFSQPWRR